MPLTAWKATIERTDVEDLLRALAAVSEGRFVDADVEEVLDVLAHTEEGGARAFRHGPPRSFAQTWIGVVPGRSTSVQVFVLGSLAFIDRVEDGMSVASFGQPRKRSEYELLRRFFLAAWSWQWTAAPFSQELRATKPKALDPERAAESMERVLSNPRSPLLELLRGLRRRTLDLLEETRDLQGADLETADAYLSTRGAVTLSEMRRRYLERQAPGAPHDS